MGSLLVEVKAKMAIYAHEKVRGLLDGEYGSVFKGRSMDFDDLREYNVGDDVKDIDWKATARTGSPLVRRYTAIRKHNILLIVDTGRNMSAATATGESKKDAAILLAGVIGSLTLRHGDFIGMVSGNNQQSRYFPLRSDSAHLEQLLQHISRNIQDDSPRSDIVRQLEYVARNLRRKMLIVIISDTIYCDETTKSMVRRIRAQHEILWLNISDINLTQSRDIVSIDSGDIIPAYLRQNAGVVAAYTRAEQSERQRFLRFLSQLAISSEQVDSEIEAVHSVYRLLERHKNARRA